VLVAAIYALGGFRDNVAQDANLQFYASSPGEPELGVGLGLVIERGPKSVQPCGANGPQPAGAPAGGAIFEISFASPDRQ
jgi:hypothetical protein